MDEGLALGVDDGVLFLAHRAADHVGLAEREARETLEDLDDLLLIDDAAVGDLEDRPQQRVLVADLFRVARALDEARDRIHRAGAVEGDHGGDIFNAARLQLGADAGHADALQLEHARGAPLAEHFEDRRVVLGDRLDTEIRLPLAHQLCRVLEHCEVAQPEEVHFQQAELLERRHLVLADHGLVVFRQRYVFIHGLFRDDDARGVHRGVARHALERFGRVDQTFDRRILFLHLAQGAGELLGLGEGHVQRAGAVRDLAGDGVGVGIVDAEHASDVAHGAARGQRAEGDDLRDMVVAVEAVDVVDNLAAAVDAEIHVDIRHGHALGV